MAETVRERWRARAGETERTLPRTDYHNHIYAYFGPRIVCIFWYACHIFWYSRHVLVRVPYFLVRVPYFGTRTKMRKLVEILPKYH